MKRNNKIEIYSFVDPDKLLAIVFKKASFRERIDISPASEILQVAHINFKKRQAVLAHSHKNIDRATSQTQEVWIILSGKGIVNLYDTDNQSIFRTAVSRNHIIILFAGGHSLQKVTKRFKFIEIKNGPYLGIDTHAI